MNFKIMAFFISVLFYLPTHVHGITEVAPKMFVMCRLGANVRSIQVNENSGSFETIYTKSGTPKSIGSGKNFESCVGFLNNVKTNLEKSGWNCKEISQVSVTKESAAE